MGNLLQILTMLPQLIVGVEKLIPQSGNGAAKLEVVKSVVAAAVPPQQQPQVMPQIEQFISLIVMFMNIAQAFKQAAPVAPTGTIVGTVYAQPSMPAPMVDVFDPKLVANPLPQQVAEVAQQAARPF